MTKQESPIDIRQTFDKGNPQDNAERASQTRLKLSPKAHDHYRKFLGQPDMHVNEYDVYQLDAFKIVLKIILKNRPAFANKDFEKMLVEMFKPLLAKKKKPDSDEYQYPHIRINHLLSEDNELLAEIAQRCKTANSQAQLEAFVKGLVGQKYPALFEHVMPKILVKKHPRKA